VSALQKAASSIKTALLLAAFSAFFLTPALVTPATAQTYYSIYGGARNTPPAPYRDTRSNNPFSEFFGALFGARPRYAWRASALCAGRRGRQEAKVGCFLQCLRSHLRRQVFPGEPRRPQGRLARQSL